ncbi:ACP phosphodiesterase [Alistipes sp. OttesenSCG-928-L06]|nr:ACP phosphodiesterase [Alistipes sp. OttesenSCG-928-L06]
MNYLAHIFLSGADSRMQLGNFIGDAVKGSAYNDYPPVMRAGILLHRAIDNFTDTHPAVRETIRGLKPHFGRYSAILLDIYFDYLLASEFDRYSDIPLRRFARRFYRALVWNRRRLPERIRRFMWHFIFRDRLGQYAHKTGIRESLEIMVAYKHIGISPEQAIDYLTQHEDELRAMFRSFFAELQQFCREAIGASAAD